MGDFNFKLNGGSTVSVTTLDPNPALKLGVRYDFIITHQNGDTESFIYTPLASMSDDQRDARPEGAISLTEQEALLIFQNQYVP